MADKYQGQHRGREWQVVDRATGEKADSGSEFDSIGAIQAANDRAAVLNHADDIANDTGWVSTDDWRENPE